MGAVARARSAPAPYLPPLRPGLPSRPRRRLDEALRLARAAGDQFAVSEALTGLGYIAFERGDHDQAQTRFEAALAAARSLSSAHFSLNALCGLGHQARVRGDAGAARARYREALARVRETGDRVFAGAVVMFYAGLEADAGRL